MSSPPWIYKKALELFGRVDTLEQRKLVPDFAANDDITSVVDMVTPAYARYRVGRVAYLSGSQNFNALDVGSYILEPGQHLNGPITYDSTTVPGGFLYSYKHDHGGGSIRAFQEYMIWQATEPFVNTVYSRSYHADFGGWSDWRLQTPLISDTGMKQEVLLASGTWTAPKTGVYFVELIGGGGGGGSRAQIMNNLYPSGYGGGGGGGGYLLFTINLTSGKQIPIVVGSGGITGPTGAPLAPGGGYSSFTVDSIIYAVGGGGGGGTGSAVNSVTTHAGGGGAGGLGAFSGGTPGYGGAGAGGGGRFAGTGGAVATEGAPSPNGSLGGVPGNGTRLGGTTLTPYGRGGDGTTVASTATGSPGSSGSQGAIIISYI